MLQTEFAKLREKVGITIEDLAVEAGFTPRTLYRWEKGDAQPRKAVITLLQNKMMFNKKDNNNFRFIDLFAGIGGLRRGFDDVGGKCVFTSEWNVYSQKTYLANYSCDHEIAGDITKVNEKDIPEHDVLLAGFPCQPFSIAGVSKKISLGLKHGFACETQGNLFFDVARIIQYHRPKFFLLENVKNLVSHDKGRTFEVIRDVLEKELGYQLHWRVIDAKSFVPQHRERIFIIGFRDKNSFDFNKLILPDSLAGPRLSSILHPEDGTERSEGHYTIGKKATIADKYTLSDKLWRYLQDYAEKHKKAGNGFGFGLCNHDSVTRTLSARYYKDGSEILISQGNKKNPRRLTPRECARLMGFDKPTDSLFKIPVSDTQAYKQFGNAVVVPVVQAVASYVLPYLLQRDISKKKLAEV